MDKQLEIAIQTITNFINKTKPFSFDEIKEEIIKEGGILRISPETTINDFLENLQERKVIYYNPFADKYDFYQHLK